MKIIVLLILPLPCHLTPQPGSRSMSSRGSAESRARFRCRRLKTFHFSRSTEGAWYRGAVAIKQTQEQRRIFT
jgi:hypothetical protein